MRERPGQGRRRTGCRRAARPSPPGGASRTGP